VPAGRFAAHAAPVVRDVHRGDLEVLGQLRQPLTAAAPEVEDGRAPWQALDEQAEIGGSDRVIHLVARHSA